MHYLLLAIAALIGVYGLYKFFLAANPRQITSFFITGLFITTCGALLLMAVTGRLPAAIAVVVAVWPIALAWWKARDTKKKTAAPNNVMTRAEAFEILGLPEKASREEIEDAYKRLMLKVHPDQQGSDWMAAKLNAARDLLLA